MGCLTSSSSIYRRKHSPNGKEYPPKANPKGPKRLGKNLPKSKPSRPHLPSACSKARLVTETRCLQLIGEDPACTQMFAAHGREALGLGGCRDETSAVLLQAELTLHCLPPRLPHSLCPGCRTEGCREESDAEDRGLVPHTAHTHTLWLCCC